MRVERRRRQERGRGNAGGGEKEGGEGKKKRDREERAGGEDRPKDKTDFICLQPNTWLLSGCSCRLA